jgi:galactofuranosylgalactofuranosylrhamnosyl-N-acetylglucosaminyl-diphospho-decaprenol beta-1,5/1,6-galactofuranosyltransferase
MLADQPTERPVPDQVASDRQHRVQRTLFAPPRDLEPIELYYSIQQGTALAERTRLAIDPHTRVDTNTYFGRFPATQWQRWTDTGQVQLLARVHGSGRLSLLASDGDGQSRVVENVAVSAPAPKWVELRADLNRFADGGALWLEAFTGREGLTLSDVGWHVAGPEHSRAAAVVFCTFNRADDCLVTLRTLADDQACLDRLDAVYVVDQGTDTVASRDGFAAVSRALGAKLHYLRQPNLGGAGGFTRGLYEATSGADADQWPYVVLMDDDIMLEPDSMLRMIGLAELAAEPVLVGGQMLQLLHPQRLHVGAEYADLARLRAGRPMPGAVHDADMTEYHQDIRVESEYNAWWSCLIPPEAIAGIGYPLPVFFQWDDIEYGLRARAAGYPTVTLPGAGVWHADFAWKDWDDWPRYFSVRNALIVSALHGEFDVARTTRFLAGELCRYLVSMRYGLALTLIVAIEDFLSGPGVLTDGGQRAVAGVRRLRAEYAETRVRPANHSPRPPGVRPGPEPSKPELVLMKRLAWHALGKSRGEASVAARDNEWWHVSLFDTAVVTDPSQEGVKIRQRDPASLRTLALRGAQVLYRFSRQARRARQDYGAAMPELTGRANWARLFGNGG